MTNRAKRRDVSTQVGVLMAKSELAVASAQELLDRRAGSGASLPGFIPEEFWCSAMRKDEIGVEKRESSSVAAEPVCGKLKLMFDDAASEPMPDALASLFDRLDIALERGELFGAKVKRPRV
jgi:hypothetical protein